jgi:hypothetical protein
LSSNSIVKFSRGNASCLNDNYIQAGTKSINLIPYSREEPDDQDDKPH